MYQDRHIKRSEHAGRRLAALLISAALIAAIAVGGTVAWLSAKTSPTVNTFTPSHVSCSVEESFDGKTKSSVNVLNTGDTEAFIRVKLVSYRVNEQGQHIGGTADIPEFTPGENWVKKGGCYYYTLPVKPGEKPASAVRKPNRKSGPISSDKAVERKTSQAIQKLNVQAIA